MLLHNLSSFINSAAGTSRTVEIDEHRADLGPELVLAGPIQGSARLHRTQRGVVVQCEADTQVELNCSRCLEPFPYPMRIRFEEEFLPAAEEPEPTEDADEPLFELDERHNLDLADPIRQYLNMNLPLAPVCRPDCPGLCPVCGAPLSGHVCPADEAPVSNSPFAALADLLDRNPEARARD